MSTGNSATGNSLQRWIPVRGPETRAMLESVQGLSEENKEQLMQEATLVLGKCVPPTDPPNDDTGLAVGFVQSGKTLNFTAVAALARDNGYPLIIVITGTSVSLFNQSNQRLIRDLGISTRRGTRRWRHVPNPRMRDVDTIRGALDNWRSGSVVPENRRQSVLITVMKQWQRLEHLNDVLQEFDLDDIPALVIDDEADQAGLNNSVNQRELSTTYERLLILKSRLPHHTYLQYTATPQAPLLINIIDAMSPSFADILTPGPDYCGGRDFFTNGSPYVRTIPDADIPRPNRILQRAPQSLIEAMRIFIIGVAYGIFSDSTEGNRSMLVHPSVTTAPHVDYVGWIRRIRRRWELTLESSSEDPAERQDLFSQFRTAYDDLATTLPNLVTDAPFDDLSDCLLEAVRTTEIIEVNARGGGSTPQIMWQNAYSHILVGGQAMDRGFTVEGLTVTYMPRSLGVGNADSIQQRARFFGYKRAYIGFCRIYVERRAREAYEGYVEHEADIHARLIAHRDEGRPLSEWRRAFFLSPGLNPTRRALLDIPFIRGMNGDDWYFPRGPHLNPDAVDANRQVAEDFLSTLTLDDDPGHFNRSQGQRHLIAEDVPLQTVFEQLLLEMRMVRMNDSLRYYGVLMQLSAWLVDHPDAVCRVCRMRPTESTFRSVNATGDMRNLHQGPRTVGGEVIYPGDFYIKATTGVTVQMHFIDIRGPAGITIGTNVPVVAVWIPNELSRPFLIQQQP